MTTTMDTDSESQDSDDGRRFRFEATRKDATTALQARRRNMTSPPPRDYSRRSRSRDRSRYDRKDERKQEYRGNNDDNNRRSSKERRTPKDDQRRKEDNYRYRDTKNYYPSKDSRESSNRDSRSRDVRESKNSRDEKHKRSRERNRDRYRRHSRDRERPNRDQIRQEDQQKIKETNKELANDNHNKITTDVQGSQDCRDLNLSDFDIVSDTEELTTENSNNKTNIKTSRGEFKERSNSEETDKVKNPHNGDDDVDDDNNKISSGPSNSNNHDVSDFLLASTSTKSSSSYNDDNNSLIYNKNDNCTEIITKLNINQSHENNTEDIDDSYGPVLPPSISKKSPVKKIIGPSLPDYLKKQIQMNDNESSEDEEDAFGPALPPHLVNKSCEILVPELTEKMDISDNVKDVKDVDDDDNDDDDDVDDGCIGPLPADHPALRDDLVQQQLEYRARMIKRELAEIDNNVDEKKREEWMTELPSIQTANLGLNPRKFRSKPGPDMSDRSGWTDTPSDRAKKEREKILMIGNGSKDKQPDEPEVMERPSKRKEKTLLETHQKKLNKKKKKEEKEAKEAGKTVRRPFDRDIDMQVNRFDEARKKTLLMKAATLDDRFSRGKI